MFIQGEVGTEGPRNKKWVCLGPTVSIFYLRYHYKNEYWMMWNRFTTFSLFPLFAFRQQCHDDVALLLDFWYDVKKMFHHYCSLFPLIVVDGAVCSILLKGLGHVVYNVGLSRLNTWTVLSVSDYQCLWQKRMCHWRLTSIQILLFNCCKFKGGRRTNFQQVHEERERIIVLFKFILRFEHFSF